MLYYTLSQFPPSSTSACNIALVWYDCTAWKLRLHVWKLPYRYFTLVQYLRHVFKPQGTINYDLNIRHFQQRTTWAWMHARMLPNYLCYMYESVGLVCFLPAHWFIQFFIRVIWEYFLIPLLYMIKFSIYVTLQSTKERETCWYTNNPTESSEKTLCIPRIWSLYSWVQVQVPGFRMTDTNATCMYMYLYSELEELPRLLPCMGELRAMFILVFNKCYNKLFV